MMCGWRIIHLVSPGRPQRIFPADDGDVIVWGILLLAGSRWVELRNHDAVSLSVLRPVLSSDGCGGAVLVRVPTRRDRCLESLKNVASAWIR